jgi:hypothetical protein
MNGQWIQVNKMNGTIVVHEANADSTFYALKTGSRLAVVKEVSYSVDIGSDQAWFWSPEWQAKEQEAEADLQEGRFQTFTELDDFLLFLDSKDEYSIDE